MRPGYDTCDDCGVTATYYPYPFPHTEPCRYGNGLAPVCRCGHDASQHESSPDGPRCHGCFLDNIPSHHLYEQRGRTAP